MVKASEVINTIEARFQRQRPQLSPLSRSHYRAVLNWLRRHRVRPDSTRLEQVQGWLEAAHHLKTLAEYELAYQILQVQPVDSSARGDSTVKETTDEKPLHALLGKWGHSAERLVLYEGLLGQLPLPQESTLIDGMAHAYHAQGHYETVLHWCDRYSEVLSQLEQKPSADDLITDHSPSRGRLYGLLGITHHAQGAFEQAIGYQQQRLSLAKAAGDLQGQATALGDLGIVHFSMGALVEAKDCHEQQLKLASQLQNGEQQLLALGSLGNVYLQMQDVRRAKAIYQQLVDQSQQQGDRLAECGALLGLGNVARAQRQLEGAIACYRQCLNMAQAAEYRRSEAIALISLAVALNAIGEGQAAYEAAERARGLAASMGSDSLRAQAVQVLGMVAQSVGAYEQAMEAWVEAIALFEDLGDRPNVGLALFNLGGMMVTLGEPEDAMGCWLRSLVIFNELNSRSQIDTVVAALSGLVRQVVGPVFFAQSLGEQSLDERPLTAERLRTALARPLADLEGDYGCEAVEGVILLLQSAMNDVGLCPSRRV